MIEDSGFQFGIPATPALATAPIAAGPGYDLNPDFGAGHNPRKSPLVNHSGEEIGIRVTIGPTFPWVLSAGTPVVQFHLILSDTEIGGGSRDPGNFVTVGSNTGPFNGTQIAGLRHLGYTDADLTVGQQIYLRFGPYSRIMGRNLPAGPPQVLAKDLRYLRVAVVNPNWAEPSGWAVNGFEGSFVKIADISGLPQDFIYPAGYGMV